MPDSSDKPPRAPSDPFHIQQFGRIEFARHFFETYLHPSFVQASDWETLELLPSRFIDGELRSHYPDLLYRVTLKEGSPAFLYLLFEHKSSVETFTAGSFSAKWFTCGTIG